MSLISKDNQHLRQKDMSLRLLLVVPFVVQIFSAVGITGYISLRNGQQSVNDLANQLNSKTDFADLTLALSTTPKMAKHTNAT